MVRLRVLASGAIFHAQVDARRFFFGARLAHEPARKGISLGTLGETYTCSSLAAEMCSVVYLTNLAPSPFADELSAAGYKVWEALSVSEVLHLCEHQTIDAVVIGPARAMDALLPLSLKLPTIRLDSEGNVGQLVWELERLFPPPKSQRIQ